MEQQEQVQEFDAELQRRVDEQGYTWGLWTANYEDSLGSRLVFSSWMNKGRSSYWMSMSEAENQMI